MWNGDTVPAVVLPLCRRENVLSVASPSSVGLEEGAFVASSVATKSVHVMIHSDAYAVVALVIMRGFVVLTLRLLGIALRSPA